jgi:hypothetical protein
MKQPFFRTRPVIFQAALLTILLSIAGPAARAQSQFAGWLGTFQTYKLSKKTGFYFDGQLRSTGQMRQMNMLLLRAGLSVALAPKFTATAGYAYILQQRLASGLSGYIPEHRSWEQLSYVLEARRNPDSRPTNITFRLRLEQRYLPQYGKRGNALVRTGNAYANRLRYFNRAVIPVGGRTRFSRPASHSPQSFVRGFYVAVQNEIFLNVGDASPVNGKFFDQNRAYAAFGYRLSKPFDLEMGYVNQYVSGTGSKSSVNHVFQIVTYVRL